MKPATATALLIAIILILVGAFLFVSHAPAPSSDQAATGTPAALEAITFPTGSATLAPGKTYTLTWHNPSAGTTTQIFLIDTSLESQGQSVSITDRVYNVANTGTYAYTVPATVQAGTYVFMIGQLRSDPFQIVSSAD